MDTVLPLHEDVKTLNEFLTPFPNIDEIFVEHQSWLKKHFLPLISIDLGMLKDEWRGQVVHMLNPFEPYEGYIGENTTDYHNEFIGENYIAFKLTDDNQYEFLGNERYFLKVANDEIQAYHDEQLADYQKTQDYYNQHGVLVNVRYPKYQGEWNQRAFMDDLGGGFWYGNWTDCPKMPSAYQMTLSNYDEDDAPNDGITISHKGNPFYYIGNVSAYNYGCAGADGIIMMYEPVSRIVLFTFDYS